MNMNHQATIPTDRVKMPFGVAEGDGLYYISSEGLPPHCIWRYPRRGIFFDQHHVDFTTVSFPHQMSEILDKQDLPEWFLASENWEDFLDIGTWNTIREPNNIKMKWHICVNIHNSHVYKIETNPHNIHLSLKSNQDMAAAIEESIRIEPISKARSECIVFINSSPRQMMECLKKYFEFVNGVVVTAEAFLVNVSQIDRAASDSGALWYLLVADYLQQDEY